MNDRKCMPNPEMEIIIIVVMKIVSQPSNTNHRSIIVTVANTDRAHINLRKFRNIIQKQNIVKSTTFVLSRV